MNMENLVDKMMTVGMDLGMRVVGAIVILVIGSYVVKLVKKAVTRLVAKKDWDETLEQYAVSTVAIVLWVFIILAVLAKFGIEIAPIIASLGVIGFTIGFALQGSLSNFAAGIMLILLRPFKLGDAVTAAGVTGSVKEIGLLSCTFTSPDNQKIIIPNSNIFGNVITNITAYDIRRVEVAVGIGYGDDISKAKQLCLETVQAHPLALKDPEATVHVVEMGACSVDMKVRCWAKTSDYWEVFTDSTENLKNALTEAGVDIPFPQQVVWMNNVDKR